MDEGAGALKTPAEVRRIIRTLATQHPNADTELHYRNAFELLVATILSAQSTVARDKLGDEHRGVVPADMDTLTALPGVGRKTANVVLGHALGVPGLPVDRHVLRVANRIGIASSDAPEKVEAQLCDALPNKMWTLASDVLILHGRRVCTARITCVIRPAT